jgi:hypothetical protein
MKKNEALPFLAQKGRFLKMNKSFSGMSKVKDALTAAIFS